MCANNNASMKTNEKKKIRKKFGSEEVKNRMGSWKLQASGQVPDDYSQQNR